MKRYSLLIASLGLLWFQSCKEIGPNIDFGAGVQAGEDTVYTTDVEAPQAKKVLAEEFTGVSCPPCPSGHDKMKAIREQLNGNLVILAYHIFNYPQGAPVEKDGQVLSKYDFRTEDATEVGVSIFGGIGAMPVAGFDRTSVAGSISLNSPSWSNAAELRGKESTPVNIHMNTTYDEATKEATVKVTLSYTTNVNVKENLTLAIVEDSIVDAQKRDLEVIKEYVHEHVLRDIITPTTGVPIPAKVEPKIPGKTYERTFKFQVSDQWHAEHCHIVAFINVDEADDRHIVQAEEVKLIN